jgi:hypothetical protein
MPREFEFAYPQDFAGLDDLALATSPSRWNSLRGKDISGTALDSRLAAADRVWLIDVDGTQPQSLAGLRLRSVYRAGDISLALYAR